MSVLGHLTANNNDHTAYRIGHDYRSAPRERACIQKVNLKFPKWPFGLERHLINQTYRTSSSVHGKLPRARPVSTFHQRHPCNKNVEYMTRVDEKLKYCQPGTKSEPISVMKKDYRPPKGTENYVVFHDNRCKQPDTKLCINYSETCSNKDQTEGSLTILPDPYLTTNEKFYTNHFREDIFHKPLPGCDNVNYASKNEYPKIIGLGSQRRKMWMPINSDVKHEAWGDERYTISKMDKSFPRVLALPPSNFESEMKSAYRPLQTAR